MTHEPILVVCLLYAALFLGLTVVMATLRTAKVATGQRQANSFSPDGTKVASKIAVA